MLLAAYSRERNPNESSDIEDKMAECSGDELGETVSDNVEPVDLTADCSGDEQVIMNNGDEVDTPRKPEPDIVAKKVPILTTREQKFKEVAKKEVRYA